MRESCYLLLILAAATGCAPRAQMLVLRPAEFDVSGIGRLAVVDFEGEGEAGKIAKSVLLAQLSENRHYALVDQGELARVLPAAFVQGQPNEAALVQAARHSGVDAILTGQVVSYNVADQKQTDQHISLGGGQSSGPLGRGSSLGIGIDTNTLLSREATVSLAIKLIDARTGEIRAARQTSHSFEGQVLNGQGDLPGQERVLGELLNQCSRDVVAMIAPHRAPVEVRLARQYWGNGLTALRKGNSKALKGNWPGAAADWQAALKDNPRNHAALHNLALASAAGGDFAGAKKQLDQAIAAYADSDYRKTQRLLNEQQKVVQVALAQVAARPAISPLAPAPRYASPPANALPPPNVLPGSAPIQQAAYANPPITLAAAIEIVKQAAVRESGGGLPFDCEGTEGADEFRVFVVYGQSRDAAGKLQGIAPGGHALYRVSKTGQLLGTAPGA
ncbi:MAG: CsgG/HfaB family protein [Pirellulaceae bacterium]|nr:CsgG/HfaB family protein [Pirellulaceae bacterium]